MDVLLPSFSCGVFQSSQRSPYVQSSISGNSPLRFSELHTWLAPAGGAPVEYTRSLSGRSSGRWSSIVASHPRPTSSPHRRYWLRCATPYYRVVFIGESFFSPGWLALRSDRGLFQIESVCRSYCTGTHAREMKFKGHRTAYLYRDRYRTIEHALCTWRRCGHCPRDIHVFCARYLATVDIPKTHVCIVEKKAHLSPV